MGNIKPFLAKTNAITKNILALAVQNGLIEELFGLRCITNRIASSPIAYLDLCGFDF